MKDTFPWICDTGLEWVVALLEGTVHCSLCRGEKHNGGSIPLRKDSLASHAEAGYHKDNEIEAKKQVPIGTSFAAASPSQWDGLSARQRKRELVLAAVAHAISCGIPPTTFERLMTPTFIKAVTAAQAAISAKTIRGSLPIIVTRTEVVSIWEVVGVRCILAVSRCIHPRPRYTYAHLCRR